MAALAVSIPVWAESSISENLNKSPLSDNQETTKRLIIRLAYIKDLAIGSLKEVAPDQVEQLENCLELVKQMTNKWQWSNVVSKVPLISPLQNFWQE